MVVSVASYDFSPRSPRGTVGTAGVIGTDSSGSGFRHLETYGGYESEKAVKVRRPSRLANVLQSGGVQMELQASDTGGGTSSGDVDLHLPTRDSSSLSEEDAREEGAEEDPDVSHMETLLNYYGFGKDQLQEQLFPENVAMMKAAEERRGIWLVFLRLNSNPCFTWLCFLIILANSVFMGFQADAIAAHARGELDSLENYKIAESSFIGWFIAESIIRCLGSSVPIYKDRFLIFDILVISLSAVEVWVLKPSNVMEGGLIVSFFAVFRVLRLTRAVKLVRAVELFRSLYTMMLAVWQSKTTFLSVIILLFILILFTALILMALLGPVSGSRKDELPQGVAERFDSLQRCMITLLETLLRGEEWGPNIVRPLLDNSEATPAGVIFIAFAAFGQFFLLNLISGIFIEAMFKTVRVNSVTLEHEHIYVDQHGAHSLKNAFLQIGDGRRALTWSEFSQGLAMHPDLVMSLGINLELAEALFHQIAYDSSDTIDIDEYIFGLIKLTRQSKTIDMLVLDYQQQRAQKDVSKLSRRFTVDMERLQLSTHKLARRLSTTLNDCQPLKSTLKARLKRQIERVHRNTVKTGDTGEADGKDDDDDDDASGGSDDESLRSGPTPPPPFLSSWMEVLSREGRPRIRHELEASLGSLLSQQGRSAAPPLVRPAAPAGDQRRGGGGGATRGGSSGSKPARSKSPAAAEKSSPWTPSVKSKWTKERERQTVLPEDQLVLPDLPESCLSASADAIVAPPQPELPST